jgi:hypothetical protein
MFQICAKTIGEKFATFLTLANLMRIRFVDLYVFKARQKEIQYGDQLPGGTPGTGELHGR